METAVAAWRQADVLARVAEGRLLDHWDSHLRMEATLPPAALLEDVARARSRANDCMTVAIGLIDLSRRVDR